MLHLAGEDKEPLQLARDEARGGNAQNSHLAAMINGSGVPCQQKRGQFCGSPRDFDDFGDKLVHGE